jgi:hypothetical protein
MKACLKCGLLWQGITHDLSKYSFREFWVSARYFQGISSPIDAEKRANGYSLAWQNHKAKNKHHWHYWTDFEEGKLIVLRMPPKYVAEMLCDWIGASKAYNKGKWTIDTLKGWYAKNKDIYYLHKSTRRYVEMVLDKATTEQSLYNLICTRLIDLCYALDENENCAYQPPYNLSIS